MAELTREPSALLFKDQGLGPPLLKLHHELNCKS